jgi:hypothetical protein
MLSFYHVHEACHTQRVILCFQQCSPLLLVGRKDSLIVRTRQRRNLCRQVHSDCLFLLMRITMRNDKNFLRQLFGQSVAVGLHPTTLSRPRRAHSPPAAPMHDELVGRRASVAQRWWPSLACCHPSTQSPGPSRPCCRATSRYCLPPSSGLAPTESPAPPPGWCCSVWARCSSSDWVRYDRVPTRSSSYNHRRQAQKFIERVRQSQGLRVGVCVREIKCLMF